MQVDLYNGRKTDSWLGLGYADSNLMKLFAGSLLHVVQECLKCIRTQQIMHRG